MTSKTLVASFVRIPLNEFWCRNSFTFHDLVGCLVLSCKDSHILRNFCRGLLETVSEKERLIENVVKVNMKNKSVFVEFVAMHNHCVLFYLCFCQVVNRAICVIYLFIYLFIIIYWHLFTSLIILLLSLALLLVFIFYHL